MTLSLTSTALHAGVIATASFTTPTGTVAANEAIPVWLTLTLDPSSDVLSTDAFGAVTSGVTPSDIAAGLLGDIPPGFDETYATDMNVNVFFECSGTFTSVCGTGPPYDFNFEFSPLSFGGNHPLTLNPGNSYQFLLGTFTPTGGSAPAGTYTFNNAGFFVQVWDRNHPVDPNDPNSQWLHLADVPIASIRASGSDPFTRDVTGSVATPEPGAFGLMAAGLGLVALARRRRAA
jgi:hypothetical protein